MPDKVDGVMFKMSFSWDGGGAPVLQDVGAVPVGRAALSEDHMVPSDANNPFLVLGLSGAAAVGAGLLLRAARPGTPLAQPKDLVLDALTGVELGTCLIGTPQAEAVCYGALSSMPLQFINRLKDPRWDFRVGMLTAGVFSLARSELGGNPIPFQGYDASSGRLQLKPGELVANAAVDVTADAGFFALSNTTAALLQGRKLKLLPAYAGIGAAYGGATSLAWNLFLGAPIKPDAALKTAATRHVAEDAGPDVSDVSKYTTFRAGGLFQSATGGMTSITLGRNVGMATDHIEPTSIGHELIHRDQVAGGYDGRAGHGLLPFYGQYLSWAPRGYMNIPYELEAYHFADKQQNAPVAGERIYGDFVAAPFALSFFALPAWLIPPPSTSE